MISASFNHAVDTATLSQFKFERVHGSDDYRIQVVGDARYLHVDASADPEVQVDHKLSARGEQNTAQTHFVLERAGGAPEEPQEPGDELHQVGAVLGFRKKPETGGGSETLQEHAGVE